MNDAERERDTLTRKIEDAHEDEAKHALTKAIGPKKVWEEQEKVYSNGGGTLTVKDLCRMASNAQLKKACKRIMNVE